MMIHHRKGGKAKKVVLQRIRLACEVADEPTVGSGHGSSMKKLRWKPGMHQMAFGLGLTPDELARCMDLCREEGAEVFEVVPLNPDRYPYAEVGAIAKSLGLEIHIGFAMPKGYNPISPDPELRRKGIEVAMFQIDRAREMGALSLTGMIHGEWGYRTGKPRTADEWKWGVESFVKICAYAKNAGIVIGVEPCQADETHFLNTPEDAARFVRTVNLLIGAPVGKVHVDLYHMMRECMSITDSLLAAGEDIGYVHISSNRRGVPGEGTVTPWNEFFLGLLAIEYEGPLVAEVFSWEAPGYPVEATAWRQVAATPQLAAVESLRYLRRMKGRYGAY